MLPVGVESLLGPEKAWASMRHLAQVFLPLSRDLQTKTMKDRILWPKANWAEMIMHRTSVGKI